MRATTAELVKSLKKKEKVRILFVCLGNICRSPAAEEIFRQEAIEIGQGANAEGKECLPGERFFVDSGGMYGGHQGQGPDRRMVIHARRRGLELTHRSRPVRESDFDRFDMIVAMDSSNASDLRDMAPTVEYERKIVDMAEFFSLATRYDYVPDPYYEGAEGFELVLDLLQDACHNLLREITPDQE